MDESKDFIDCEGSLKNVTVDKIGLNKHHIDPERIMERAMNRNFDRIPAGFSQDSKNSINKLNEAKGVHNPAPSESVPENVTELSYDETDGNTMDVEDKLTSEKQDLVLHSTYVIDDRCLKKPVQCKEKGEDCDAEMNLMDDMNSSDSGGKFFVSDFQSICENSVKAIKKKIKAGKETADNGVKGDNEDESGNEVISTDYNGDEAGGKCAVKEIAGINGVKGDDKVEIVKDPSETELLVHEDQQSGLERSESNVEKTDMNAEEKASTMEIEDFNVRSEAHMVSQDCKSQMSLKRKLCEKYEQLNQKSEVKKSRKQSVPKRLLKTAETFPTEDPDVDEGIQMLIENMAVQENQETLYENEKAVTPEDASQNEKCEKSRKQVNPKRILMESGVYQSDGRLYESSEKSEVMVTDVIPKAKSVLDGMAEVPEVEKVKGEPNDVRENCESKAEPGSIHKNFNYKLFDAKPASVPDFEKQLLALGCSADNIDLLSKFSPSMLKSSFQSNMGSPLSAELQNMEYIRQMREVRTSRYRKISIEEKREIADYAKENGVSVAANFFNVSKSAVSMWSRTDFDEVERLHLNRKRNCMLGNEKFEALCARVRLHKENKFRDLSKQDKIEASRYAKLVGVREMARCLDVALGTISGWMRQFPYVVKSDLLEESSSQENSRESSSYDGGAANMIENSSEEISVDGFSCENSSFECAMTESSSDNCSLTRKKRKRKNVEWKNHTEVVNGNVTDKLVNYLAQKHTNSDKKVDKKQSVKRKRNSASETSLKQDDKAHVQNEGNEMYLRICDEECTNDDLDENVEQEDDLDQLIADTLYKQPDIDALYEEKKGLMAGTELEGDEQFKDLFTRVVKCRSQKYKNLSARDKMDVCRYGKRAGVRRVGKVLGLATGTLSGWNTKYQMFLNDSNGAMLEPSVNLNGKLSVSDICKQIIDSDMSLDGNAQSSAQKSNYDISDTESAEVSAVKCLFKEKYSNIKKRIEIAKTMKFKNMSSDEKIEIVKCAKLIGIRPTARVLNVPIGTLSGWISKYSGDLHPMYNTDKTLPYGESMNFHTSLSWPYLLKDPGSFLPTMLSPRLASTMGQLRENSDGDSADSGSDFVNNSNSVNDTSNYMNFDSSSMLTESNVNSVSNSLNDSNSILTSNVSKALT